MSCCCCNTIQNGGRKMEMKENQSCYKRTLPNNQRISNWQTRNGSTQISSLLSPDLQTNENETSECACHVTKTKARIKWAPAYTTSKYHMKCFARKPKYKFKPKVVKRNVPTSLNGGLEEKPKRRFKNECYCCEEAEPPLVGPSASVRDYSRDQTSDPLLKNNFQSISGHSLDTLKKARSLLDYTPESQFLKQLRNEAQQVQDCDCPSCRLSKPKLQYSKQRALLEKAYRKVDRPELRPCPCRKCYGPCAEQLEKSHKNVDKPCHKCCVGQPQESPESPNASFNLTELTDIDAKISKVRQIRDQNFFDCHCISSKTLLESSPHKCIHKFTLDERQLPKPLNSDPYGRSRCSVCNKTMQRTPPMSPKSFLTQQRPQTSAKLKPQTPKSRPQTPKSRLQTPKSKLVQVTPRQINIGSRNDLIYLDVGSNFMAERKGMKFKKNGAPSNSWALRYQKGVV